MGATSPQTNFTEVLGHLLGFENFTFFDLKNELFSLHPNAHVSFAFSRSRLEFKLGFGLDLEQVLVKVSV